MSEWKTVKLGEILQIQPKSKIKAGDGSKVGIFPFYTCSNELTKKIDTADYEGPALVFGTGGNASVHYVDDKFSTSTDCLVYKTKSNTNLSLINKYLRTNIYLLENGFKGAGLKHISRDYISNIEIKLPDSTVQEKVVSQLDLLESNISKHKTILEKLDLLIKSRFIEMFGDPITNPKHWNTKAITELCENIMGGGTPSKSKPEYFEGTIPWVSPKDMKSLFVLDSQDHITEDAVNNSSAKKIKSDSILMVIRSGILKHTLPVAMNKVEVTINQDMKAFIPSSEINPYYLLFYFKGIERDVLSGVRAVTADNIDFNQFKKRHVILPPKQMQDDFASFVQQIDKSKFEIWLYLNLCYIIEKRVFTYD